MADKLNWVTVAMDTLPADARAAFAAITAAKANFEKIFAAALVNAGAVPSGMRVRVSDKWGKLSFALEKDNGTGGGTFAFTTAPIPAPTAAPTAPASGPAAAPAQGGKHK